MPRRLFVGNLPWSVSSEELGSMFADFGSVEFAEVKYKDPEKRQSRGIGFVQLETDEQAEAAIKALDGTEVGGRMIVVNHALPRTPRTDGPRPYGQDNGYHHNRGNQRSNQDGQPEQPLQVVEGGLSDETADSEELAA